MDRRRFLGQSVVSAAGLAAGGTALWTRQLEQAAQERNGSALPDGPRRECGCRRVVWSVPASGPWPP
jgi:hypothetical protein